MKIVRLQSENVKRIKAIEVTPDGSAVIVRGKNSQGKSSLLDSIEYVFGGKRTHPKKVIRAGEEQAKVVVDLGDMIVERKWTADDKSQLVVSSKDGARYQSPQKMLDDLIGKLSFDPLGFMRMDPRQQADTIRELVGLDFTDLDAQRDKHFSERTVANREVGRIQASMGDEPEEMPTEEVVVSSLVDTLEGMNDALQELSDVESRKLDAQRDVEDLEAVIKEMEVTLKAKRRKLAAAEKDLASITETEEKLAADKPDTESVRKQIAEAESHNHKYRVAQEWRANTQALEDAQQEAKALTAKLDTIAAERKERIQDAEFPVPGLSVGDDGVLLGDLPFEQVSQSEQLQVSVAMGIALNPKLRVLLLREASFLDEEHLKIVAEMAEKADAQVWMEVVGEEGVGVVIEDGSIKKTKAVKEVA